MLPNLTVFYSVASPLCAAFGVLLKVIYDHFKHKKQLYVDDGTALRKDLLEERKTLLNQLLAERRFYSDQIETMNKRLTYLEEQNHTKDQMILEQQGKLNAQELQLDSQSALISALQGELNAIRADIKTASSA